MSHAQYLAVRDDPKFHHVLVLARIVNSIRFAQVAYLTRGDDGSPSAMRQSVASMFYLASALRDALQFVELHLPGEFSTSAVYQAYLAPLLVDPELQSLRKGMLDRLRNGAISHNDPRAVASGLRRMDGAEYVFASAGGATNGDVYYDLTDLAVLHFALEMKPTEDFTARFRVALGAVARLAARFGAAADKLIVEYLHATRCARAQVVPISDAAGATGPDIIARPSDEAKGSPLDPSATP